MNTSNEKFLYALFTVAGIVYLGLAVGNALIYFYPKETIDMSESETTVIYGASDDLIILEGVINEEIKTNFSIVFLAFNDGTIIKIKYDHFGVWRFKPLAKGTAFIRNSEYADRLYLSNLATVCVFGYTAIVDNKLITADNEEGATKMKVNILTNHDLNEIAASGVHGVVTMTTGGANALVAEVRRFRNARVYNEIRRERERQDAKWGGPEHDDTKRMKDFTSAIRAYAAWAEQMAVMGSGEKLRNRLVQTAALAVAAIESYDRRGLER